MGQSHLLKTQKWPRPGLKITNKKEVFSILKKITMERIVEKIQICEELTGERLKTRDIRQTSPFFSFSKLL